MGRAIVRDPKVFLFDEPLSNLDAKLRVQMRAEIKALHQRLSTTTVYVTHDQIEAMTMADKIVVMRDGLIEQAGSPLELYDRPCNVFVASFIGSPSMNLIRGEVSSSGFVTEGNVLLPTPPNSPKATVYGIRPEHLHVDPEGVQINVEVIEPTGSETHVVANLGGQRLECAFRERILVKPGARLTVKPDLSAVHLFDDSGRRVN